MGEIRAPKPSEHPRIVEMGRNFYATLPQYAHIPYSEESGYRWIERMLADGILIVAVESGEVVGVAGGLFAPCIFNDKYFVGQELLWWIEPEHRGSGIGIELLREMEALAEVSADLWVMVALEGTGIGKIYERAGYSAGEQLYFKVMD